VFAELSFAEHALVSEGDKVGGLKFRKGGWPPLFFDIAHSAESDIAGADESI
jgi:hypothetical protein